MQCCFTCHINLACQQCWWCLGICQNVAFSVRVVLKMCTYLLGKEASPSIGNALWCVSTMFTRSAITPPAVNGYGWNWGNSEYIVWSWPWQNLGAIRAEARAGDLAEVLVFCQVNNARLCRFPVSQISRNLHTRRDSVTWWILSE